MRWRLALLLISLSLALPLWAAEAERPDADREPEPESGGELRIPLPTLVERSLGLVKRPAIFEWRKASFIPGLSLGQAIEYNNFNSSALTLDLSFPLGSFIYRTSLSRVVVRDSDSSLRLRESPYFQAGRPSRWEWRHALAMPLHEGIGSQVTSMIRPTQFVVSGIAELGINLYPSSGLGALTQIYKTRLTGKELEDLAKVAPESMHVSGFRHDLGLGLAWDNYFAGGAFWTFRFLLHRAPAGRSGDLSAWQSFALGAGYAL